MALKKVTTGTDSRVGNTPTATIIWDAACGVDVTGYDKNLNVVLAAFAESTAAHGNQAFLQTDLWYDIDSSGTWTQVTGATAVAMAANGALTDNDPVGASAGCQTTDTDEEWTTATGGTFNFTYNLIAEAQFGLDISAVADGSVITFSFNDGAVVLDVSITIAAGSTTYEIITASNLRVNVIDQSVTPIASNLRVKVLDQQLTPIPSNLRIVIPQELAPVPSNLRVKALGQELTAVPSNLAVKVFDQELTPVPSNLRVKILDQELSPVPSNLRVKALEQELVPVPSNLRVKVLDQELALVPSNLRVKVLGQQLSPISSNLQVVVGVSTEEIIVSSNLRVILLDQELAPVPSNLRVKVLEQELVPIPSNLKVVMLDQELAPVPSNLRVKVLDQELAPIPSNLRIVIEQELTPVPSNLRVKALGQEIFIPSNLAVKVFDQQIVVASNLRVGVFFDVQVPSNLRVKVLDQELSPVSSNLRVKILAQELTPIPSNLRVLAVTTYEIQVPSNIRVKALDQEIQTPSNLRVKVVDNELTPIPSNLRIVIEQELTPVPSNLRVKALGQELFTPSNLRVKLLDQQIVKSSNLNVALVTSIIVPSNIRVRVFDQQIIKASNLRVISLSGLFIVVPSNLRVKGTQVIAKSSNLRVLLPPLITISDDDSDVGIVRKLMAQAGRQTIVVHENEIVYKFLEDEGNDEVLYTAFNDVMNIQGIWLDTDINHSGTNYYSGSTIYPNEGKIVLTQALPVGQEEMLITYASRDGLSDDTIQANIEMAKQYLTVELWRATLDFSGASNLSNMAKWSMFSLTTFYCLLSANTGNAIQAGFNYRFEDFEIQTKLWGEGMIAETLLNKYEQRSKDMVDALKLYTEYPEAPIYVVNRTNSMTPYNQNPHIFDTMVSISRTTIYDSLHSYAFVIKYWGN